MVSSSPGKRDLAAILTGENVLQEVLVVGYVAEPVGEDDDASTLSMLLLRVGVTFLTELLG